MGFEQVFDSLTFKHMDALRKQIQSLVDYVLNHRFWALPWVPDSLSKRILGTGSYSLLILS